MFDKLIFYQNAVWDSHLLINYWNLEFSTGRNVIPERTELPIMKFCKVEKTVQLLKATQYFVVYSIDSCFKDNK